MRSFLRSMSFLAAVGVALVAYWAIAGKSGMEGDTIVSRLVDLGNQALQRFNLKEDRRDRYDLLLANLKQQIDLRLRDSKASKDREPEFLRHTRDLEASYTRLQELIGQLREEQSSRSESENTPTKSDESSAPTGREIGDPRMSKSKRESEIEAAIHDELNRVLASQRPPDEST